MATYQQQAHALRLRKARDAHGVRRDAGRVLEQRKVGLWPRRVCCAEACAGPLVHLGSRLLKVDPMGPVDKHGASLRQKVDVRAAQNHPCRGSIECSVGAQDR